MVITPFTPNVNKQAIPRSESENIKRTALYQPLKINFDGKAIAGHKDSIPIGPIIEVSETDEEITGRAIIWNDEFSETVEYLKSNVLPGTSWEIYYHSSEIDTDGIEWLQGCVYAGNTIVSNPSYGNKTLLRAIASDLKVESEMEEERKEIEELQNTLNSIWSMLDDFWFKTFEIEAAESTKTENLDTFSSRLNGLVTKLTDRANDAGVTLAETKAALETATAELTTLKNEKEKAEKDKVLAERKAKLSDVGIEVTEERKESILAMSEDLFNQYVSDLRAVKGNSTQAETKSIPLPEPLGKLDYSNDEITSAHKELTKKSKRG